jgi:peroxiredoxin
VAHVQAKTAIATAGTANTTIKTRAAAVMAAFAHIRKVILISVLYGGKAIAALPHFTLPIVNGNQGEVFDSSKIKSNILIEFYFNSCPACNQNAPKIQKIAKEFHGDRTKILEIGVDCETNDYKDWMRKHPPEGLILNSCEGTIQDELNVSGYPTSFIFDCDGKQVFKHIGVWSNSDAQRAHEILTNMQFKSCQK